MDRSSPGWVTDPTAPAEPGELRRIAVAVATETAALAARVRERVVDPEGGLDTKSSATDVVTEGDTACEALVRRRLAELRPGDSVLGEEGGTEEGRTGVRWVVDPIDGTVNYTRGLPWFAVSLGVEIDGVPAAGAVVEPVSGRVWSAARGLGATRDGMPLRASRLDRVDLAVIGTGLNYDPARRRRQAALVARVAGAVGDLRRTGCASLDLCAVAAGWTDGFYEHGLHAWDVAAVPSSRRRRGRGWCSRGTSGPAPRRGRRRPAATSTGWGTTPCSRPDRPWRHLSPPCCAGRAPARSDLAVVRVSCCRRRRAGC